MIATFHKASKGRRVSLRSRLQRDERGSVLTEFVMVAPVMLLIAGSALRFYQELQAQEIGITFAREVATLAYNRCIDKTHTTVQVNSTTNQEEVRGEAGETLVQIGTCINDEVLGIFNESWETAKPTSAGTEPLTITVEAYRCDIEQISPTTCNKKGKVTCTSSPSGCTTALDDKTATLSALRNRKVIARIEFTMSPLATFIPSIESRKVTYEATV